MSFREFSFPSIGNALADLPTSHYHYAVSSIFFS